MKYIKTQALCRTGDRILIGFSGGRDSVCLAHLLLKAGVKPALAHVNYGLRGADSDADEAFARQCASQWNIPIYVLNEDFPKGENLQERARKLRYAFFQKMCSAHDYLAIATAHHQDDDLETFMVQLLRGSSLRALGGIPVKNENVIRPLLFANRTMIDDYIQENNLEFREDQSNASLNYLRNRVRHQLIPLASTLEPHALENLKSVSARLAEHTAATEALTESFWESSAKKAILIDRLPRSQRGFWLHEAVYDLGFTRTQCNNILSAKQSGKEVASAHWRMILNGDRLDVAAVLGHEMPTAILHEFGSISNKTYSVTAQKADELLRDPQNLRVVLDADKAYFPIEFAPWQPGDRFRPLGADYSVKVKDYLSDKKLGRLQKERTIVARSGRQIIWIPGVAMAEEAKVTPQTKELITIEFCYIRE